MEVNRELKKWPEANVRKRKWMTPAEAIEAVDEQELKALLSTAATQLQATSDS